MKIPGALATLFYFFRFFYFTIKERSARFLRYYPGHYSSPVPSYRQLLDRKEQLFVTSHETLAGIDLNRDSQLELLGKFYQYAEDFDFPKNAQPGSRYYLNNPMFGPSDAYVLYSFLRYFKPQRYTEIGSGYSSSLVIDCKEKWNTAQPELTFIEPYPVRLDLLLSDTDRQNTKIILKNVQDVETHPFTLLQANDILFVDSSHMLRIDSDLTKILFSILPMLKSGVLVHFHDIFWPFENPETVVMKDGRLWNEAYLLRAFLQYNDNFKIVYFQHYLKTLHGQEMAARVPAFKKSGGGSSLWLVKK